jgi:hypothetical protein
LKDEKGNCLWCRPATQLLVIYSAHAQDYIVAKITANNVRIARLVSTICGWHELILAGGNIFC